MSNISADTTENITAFFNYVDSDHDGYITVAEIQEAMGVDLNADLFVSQDEKVISGQKWMSSHFNAQDANGDSKLTLTELLNYNTTQ